MHVEMERGRALLRNNADWRSLLWIVKYFTFSACAWLYDGAIMTSHWMYVVTFIVLAYYSFAGATIVHNVQC